MVEDRIIPQARRRRREQFELSLSQMVREYIGQHKVKETSQSLFKRLVNEASS